MTEIPPHLRQRAAHARTKADAESAARTKIPESLLLRSKKRKAELNGEINAAELTLEEFCEDPHGILVELIAAVDSAIDRANADQLSEVEEINRKIRLMQAEIEQIKIAAEAAALRSSTMDLRHHEESLRNNPDATMNKILEIFKDVKALS